MKTWLSEDPGKPIGDVPVRSGAEHEPIAHSLRDGQNTQETPATSVEPSSYVVANPAPETPARPVDAVVPEILTDSTKTVKKSSLIRWVGRGIAANPIWRTRGLWLGGLGVGLAMYAQKMLSVDSQILSSIHWYALAIFVMLVAWLGTYKNKSLLAEPVPQGERKRWIFQRRRAAEADLPISTVQAATLPVRVAASRINPPATTLPVRAKRLTTPQPVVEIGGEDGVESSDSSSLPVSSVQSQSGDASIDGVNSGVAPQVTENTQRALPGVATWRRLTLRYPVLALSWPRYALAFLALAINLFSAEQLRRDYFSPVGGYGWLLSLTLLLVAFIGERRKPALPSDPGARDVEDRTGVTLPRYVEWGIIIAIVLLAFALRVFRLDDWTGAMHGDEGEFGMDAISIVNGDHISPFMTGWFYHPNFSFFSIAAMMKIFGTGLFGLRILSALLGALMVLPFYGLVRMWFGVRMAVIASLLLAFMDVSLYFGKLGLNNIETPFFVVTGLYFFFRGIKSLRTLDFVLAAYTFMLTLYFYFGGRLTPFLVLAIILYMFVFMPFMRLPGIYFDIRKRQPVVTRISALGQAARHQLRGVWQYAGRLVIFGIACYCLASPWLLYFEDPQHQVEMNTRSNEKLIFNPTNLNVVTSQTGASSEPLYLGFRMPTSDDVYPFSPIVFEKTPTSIKLTDNGFWPRVLWVQTTKTLSMFTYRKDESSFYTITNEAAAKPIEAALLILGLAWALWRWRDTRMAVLSLWFWSTILAGGALTIDAPYMPRLVGIVPALAIFIAIPLNKMAAEVVGAAGMFGRATKWVRARLRVGVAISGVALGILLLYLGLENTYDYYSRYLDSQPNREHLGTANFVRFMNDKTVAEGRPTPQYFDMGHPFFYWGYGINRFLNNGTNGTDLTNASNELPILNNDDRDVVFMVWDYTRQYLPVIESYYPGGEKADYVYGPASNPSTPFSYYRVKREQIDARRHSSATYAPAGGAVAIQRDENGLGSIDAPPTGLQYPVQASWNTDIVTPAAGSFSFSLDAPGDGSLLIDGQPLLATSASTHHVEGSVMLARGPHEVKLAGALADAGQKVTLMWAAGSTTFTAVPRQYLWNGPGRGLLGEIRAFTGSDLLSPAPDTGHIITARVDGFLGFRSSPEALIPGSLKARWTGTFDVTKAGSYAFSVCSNGGSVILIDGGLLVDNSGGTGCPQEASGTADLTPGTHHYELRYIWAQNGTGYLEASWTPPGGTKSLITPDVFSTSGGILDPASLETALPPVQLKPEPPAAKIDPDRVIGSSDELARPKGLGVDQTGNIYVGDRGNHRVVVYSPDGKKLREWGKAAPTVPAGQTAPAHEGGEFADISDLAVTQDGTVYVFDSTPRVQAFKQTGEYIGSFEPDQLGLYGPNGIANEAPSPNSGTGQTMQGLYIAVTGQNRILKLPYVEDVLEGKAKLPANTESASGSEGDKLEQPVDVVADPSGSGFLYAIDLKERLVQLKATSNTPDPSRVWGVSAQWRVPIGKDDGGSRLAISQDGKHVYMSDPDRHRVAVINIVSGDVSFFGHEGSGSGEFGKPSGIAVGPGGRVYVLDSVNNNVQVFSPEKVAK